MVEADRCDRMPPMKQASRETITRRLTGLLTNRWVVGGSLSVLILGWLLSFADISSFRQFAHAFDTGFAFAMVAATAAGYFAGAWRLNLLVQTIVPAQFGKDMAVTVSHRFFLAVLPARLGEIAYVILLKRHYNISFGLGAATLIVSRVYDVIVVAIAFLIGIVGSIETSESRPHLIAISIGMVSICVAIIVFAPKSLTLLAAICYSGFLPRARWVRKFQRSVLIARRWVRSELSPKLHFYLLISTTIRWMLDFIAVYFAFTCIGVSLSALGVMFLAGGMNLIGGLPIQTIGGFGLLEAGMTGLLMLLGFERGSAVSAAVISRLAMFLIPVLFWILWMLSPARRWYSGTSSPSKT